MYIVFIIDIEKLRYKEDYKFGVKQDETTKSFLKAR